MKDQIQESRIRLVLLDSHGLFRMSLSRLLASEPDLAVASECGTSAEALEVLNTSAVDVVLLDFDVGSEHGTDFISAARQAGYDGRFLIVAGSADVWNAAMALKRGASGIFLKSDTPERLLQAIRIVGKGGNWVDQGILQLLADQSIDRYPRLEDHRSEPSLEDRERKVLRGIVDGLTNRKIGLNMGLSESCIKNVVQHLFSKAGVNTRGQLVRVALEGWLGDPHESIKRQPNGMLNSTALHSYDRRQPADANLPAERHNVSR
jgi:two-component system, NarL family, nitrate/nitrite response regulator NarL